MSKESAVISILKECHLDPDELAAALRRWYGLSKERQNSLRDRPSSDVVAVLLPQ